MTHNISATKPEPDKQLEVLHDHYKETCARIWAIKASRDRLFLWVIGLFALLSLEIGYPAAVGGSLGKLTLGEIEINLQLLPLPALLTASWALTLAIGLRYCQKSVLIKRQYPYLHSLEDEISLRVGGGNLYQREGKKYLEEYPFLLDAAWIAYVVLFPTIVIIAIVGLLWWEITRLPYPMLLRIIDIVIAVALGVFFFLYLVPPGLAAKFGKKNVGNTAGTTQQGPPSGNNP